MRQRSSDSSKSNSTVTTTPGNSQLDYSPPIITPPNPTSMRTPLAWQNRDEAFLMGSRNISRPQSSAHTRRSINVHRTHQQKIQEQKQTAAQTAAAVIAQLQQKSTNGHSKHYNQNASFSSKKAKPLHQRSSSSSSITKSLINKQQQLNKQLQQQQQFLKQQMLHRKAAIDNSSSPSVATTSSDGDEIPIVKHCRRTAASRASNNPSMISQLTRHSQLVTIPQAALLTTSNASTRQEPSIRCIPTSAYRNQNATLRSTRSVPAIVYQQQHHAQQQQLIHQQQQLLYNHHHHNQNSNDFNGVDNLDSCPVHGSNAINSLTNHNSTAIHKNQLLPSQLSQISNHNNRSSILNIRKFASVNDLTNRTAAVNYLQTANSQLIPTVFSVANHPHNLSAIQTPIKTNASNNDAKLAKLAMTTNLLPLPMHPAVATASTIYTQPIQIATSRPAPVLIPTFTTEPNFAIAKHNKEQLINIVNSSSNQADACCKGHLIVLWIILAIVVVGIVAGVILGLTI